MTQDYKHPITPPPELVEQWMQDHTTKYDLARHAAQWGADCELEACITWMKRLGYWGDDGKAIPALRTARRLKPPSLKEQAIAVLDHTTKGWGLAEVDLNTIRRALEALPDD
jgi:hypothetical protein